MNANNQKILAEAVANEFPFALYHLPGDDKLSVIIQQEGSLALQPFKMIDGLKGFFVAPFRGKNINELYCLNPDIYFEEKIDQEVLADIFGLFLDNSIGQESAYSMDKKEYIDRLKYLVELLKEGDLRKVVMSRVINYFLPTNFNPALFLLDLIAAYPDAFVYMAYLPGIGTWIGATPEVLLRVMNDFAETVALAGTKTSGSAEWTFKEKKEQQIVMDYIEEELDRHGIDEYSAKGPFTVEAGDLLHLKTSYRFPLQKLKGHLGNLIAGLHPTPAVCGLPRNKAYELLSKVEKHDREIYTGFVGPWNLGGASQLFVNLRCAKLHNNNMSLFVGGGITAESNPEAEWEETNRKSKTLLSVVEKM